MFLQQDIRGGWCIDHRFVQERHGKERTLLVPEGTVLPSDWRKAWLNASPGLRAVLNTESEESDLVPGRAAAVVEALRAKQYGLAIQDVKQARSRRQNRTAAQLPPATPQRLATPRTRAPGTPRERPAHAQTTGGAEVCNLEQGEDIGSWRSKIPSSLPPMARAVRTSFRYMATSPTYRHKDDLNWFGQVSGEKSDRSSASACKDEDSGW
mmetsp:Transcript_111865/g.204965  ORF Transcript_111865/g.204965 Transcript_111865/m.204965 type:complete len:210 (-) Transcript_111865:80-709(-)